jgi:Flp pilus assembly protein TadB
MTPDAEEHEQQLHDAHRASHNAVVLMVITVAFGFVWVAELDRIPALVAGFWFIVAIPVSLYLVYVYRRRYRELRDETPAVVDIREHHPRR